MRIEILRIIRNFCVLTVKLLAFVFDQKLPKQSGGIKEILLKILCPKELGVLNTPTHLLHFHPKFLLLDETLSGDETRVTYCDIMILNLIKIKALGGKL